MSLVIIVGTSTPPSGPVASIIAEVQKAQTAYAFTILYYEAKQFNPRSLIETQQAQTVYAVTNLSYVVSAKAQTLAESQKAQIAYAVTNLSYS